MKTEDKIQALYIIKNDLMNESQFVFNELEKNPVNHRQIELYVLYHVSIRNIDEIIKFLETQLTEKNLEQFLTGPEADHDI